MSEIAASAENAYGETELGEAPVAIIVYMDETTSSTNPSFDCGLACQNMVVAASALGYGAKIVAYPTDALNMHPMKYGYASLSFRQAAVKHFLLLDLLLNMLSSMI